MSFPCPLCLFKAPFKTRSGYHKHKQKEHPQAENQILKCGKICSFETCRRQFSSYTKLIEHLQEDHSIDIKTDTFIFSSEEGKIFIFDNLCN